MLKLEEAQIGNFYQHHVVLHKYKEISDDVECFTMSIHRVILVIAIHSIGCVSGCERRLAISPASSLFYLERESLPTKC